MIRRSIRAMLAGGAALMLSGCVPTEMSGSKGNAEASIYYASQAEADAALAAFDRDNPKCELWTNWQKMCSRTGLNASVRCTHSAVQVEPSTPFCVARSDGPYLGIEDGASDNQVKSYQRFTVPNIDDVGEALADLRWSERRPFNNLRLSELSHPWCRRWARAVRPEVNKHLSRHSGYYCAARNIPAWCEWADGMGIGPQDGEVRPPARSGEIIPVGPLDPASIPINGIFCVTRKSNAPK